MARQLHVSGAMAFELHFTACRDVSQQLIDEAFCAPNSADESLPRDRVLRLLKRMARVSRPDQDSGRIFLVLARLAEAPWLGGRLDVRLSDRGEQCGLELRLDEGSHFTPLSEFTLEVSLTELRSWIRENCDLLAPLQCLGSAEGPLIRIRVPMPTRLRVDPHTRDTLEYDSTGVVPASRRPTVRVRVAGAGSGQSGGTRG